MSSAEDLTDGGSVEWARVATAVFGTWATAFILYTVELVDVLANGVEWILTGAVGYYSTVAEALLAIPGATLDKAWSSAADFVGTLGAFGLPAAVIITFSAMFILYTVLEVVLFE